MTFIDAWASTFFKLQVSSMQMLVLYSRLQNWLHMHLPTSKILFSPCRTRNPGNKLANGSEAAKDHPRQNLPRL